MNGRYARAGRALLGWTQKDLAVAAKIGVRTVKRFENDEEMKPLIGWAIRQAMADAGLRVFADAGELAGLEGDISGAIVMVTN